MKSSIRIKLLASFSLLLVLVIAVGYRILSTNQGTLEETVGRASVFLAEDTIQRIDKSIFLRIEQLELFARDPVLREALKQSNEASGETDEAVLEALSDRLRDIFIRFSEREYGYRNYSEVLVTDAQGVAVARTGEVSSKNRANEAWWQSAKTDVIHVGNFEYSDATDIWGIPLAVGIRDENEEFIGVIRAVFPTDIIIREEELTTKKYDTTEVTLLTGNGSIVYETGAFRFLQDISGEPLFAHIKGITQSKTGGSGFFIEERRGKERLFAHALSRGYRNYEGLGWVLLISHDIDEVFGPVRALRNQLLIVISVLVLAILFLAFLLSRSISTPIKKLTETAQSISGGNLDQRVTVKSKDEVGQLGKTFNFMADTLQSSYAQLQKQIKELEELDQLKNDFLNNTSHELKTPLIPIKSQSQLLLSDTYGKLSKEQHEAVSMIYRNEERLRGLVNDVVDSSKIHSKKLNIILKEVDLAKLIEQSVQDVEELADERGITLKLKPIPRLPKLRLDARRIAQVMGNLLGNALKFTPEGGVVIVKVIKDKKGVAVSVTDTGIGMGPQTLKKLFTPFFQADSDAARKYPGTGLGLSISQGFIKAHDGTIRAESEGEGKGSVFTFTLPV